MTELNTKPQGSDDASTVCQQQTHDLIANVWNFPDMQVVIDFDEVQRQYAQQPSPHSFTEVVSEMLNSFLHQMESSESPKDIISMEKDLDLEDRQAVAQAVREAFSSGAIYLFPYDYETVLHQHQLPFGKKDLVRTIDENWLFGFLTPTLPNWYFIGFVNRQDITDTYNTGFKKKQMSA